MRGFALLLRSILLLFLAAGCAAQPAAPVTQQLPLNRRIENQLRSQYSIPPSVEITVGEAKPSDVSGFDTLPVALKTSSRTTTLEFLLSKDKKTLAHLEKFDITVDPSSKIDLNGRPVRGNKDAKVTIINYDDFQCPFCARMHQTLNQELLNIYGDKIRIIYKDYPLYSIHPWALHAAVDANCLNQQSAPAYWEFADYVHANQSAVSSEKGERRTLPQQTAELDRLTAEQGKKSHLDTTKLNACIKTQDDTQVKASSKEGDDLGVDSTPTMFINGEKISGAVPLAAMLPIINRALRDAGIAVPYAAEAPGETAGKPESAKPENKDKPNGGPEKK